MESSRRDLLNDMAENSLTLKNNKNTYHSHFNFISKTGRSIAFPKTGFCCYGAIKSKTYKMSVFQSWKAIRFQFTLSKRQKKNHQLIKFFLKKTENFGQECLNF